ncbi:hypothetical protein B0H13DRAFT_2303706 [Mycena leptocephala]|nr:hypothetical protein B0H13DRAFT_2303706 [Mycena leptocephala]
MNTYGKIKATEFFSEGNIFRIVRRWENDDGWVSPNEGWGLNVEEAFGKRVAKGTRSSSAPARHQPPPGLIRWHYLQCVLKKFGHADYKTLPNIKYSELPLRMEGDSDDDGTDSEAEWPSAALDRGRAVDARRERRRRTTTIGRKLVNNTQKWNRGEDRGLRDTSVDEDKL